MIVISGTVDCEYANKQLGAVLESGRHILRGARQESRNVDEGDESGC